MFNIGLVLSLEFFSTLNILVVNFTHYKVQINWEASKLIHLIKCLSKFKELHCIKSRSIKLPKVQNGDMPKLQSQICNIVKILKDYFIF
jgi:hypothetical protein